MPEWVKVLAGCLLIIVIGASAPILIIDGLYLRQHRSPEINRTAKQERTETADPKKTTETTNNSSDQLSTVNETIAAIDKSKSGSDQTERGGKKEVEEAYFHIGSLRFKITDSIVALFTALQVVVGAIQGVLLYLTVCISRKTAETLPRLERAYIFIEIDPYFGRWMESVLESMDQYASIDYQLANHGKTPAVIKAISVEFNHCADLSKEIRYVDEPSSGEIVIRSGGVYPPPFERSPSTIDNRTIIYFQRQQQLSKPLSAEAISSIREGGRFVWFYGRVLYDDVFADTHETRFCWRYNGQTKTMEQYNRKGEDLSRRT